MSCNCRAEWRVLYLSAVRDARLVLVTLASERPQLTISALIGTWSMASLDFFGFGLPLLVFSTVKFENYGYGLTSCHRPRRDVSIAICSAAQ